MSYRFGLSETEKDEFYDLQFRYRARFVHEALKARAEEGEVDLEAVSQEQFDALVCEYDEMLDNGDWWTEDAGYVVSKFLKGERSPR